MKQRIHCNVKEITDSRTSYVVLHVIPTQGDSVMKFNFS